MINCLLSLICPVPIFRLSWDTKNDTEMTFEIKKCTYKTILGSSFVNGTVLNILRQFLLICLKPRKGGEGEEEADLLYELC